MTTATPAAAAATPPITGTSPLALVQEQPGGLSSVQEIVWTKERIDLIKRMKCPPNTTDDEFAIFLMQCKRTGMDPLIDEADMVPRRSKQRVWKDGPAGRFYVYEEVEKKVFQPREAGMRARADRFPDYRGVDFAHVREGDHFKIGKSKDGTQWVEHEFNPADPKRLEKPIMGAWAQIKREGRSCPVVWLDIAARLQTKKDGEVTVFWTQKQAEMIEKCARAHAYRLEYPNTFAGIHISEEMDQEEEREVNAAPVKDAPAAAPSSKTADVLGKVNQKLGRVAPEDAQVVTPPSAPAAPAGKKQREPGTYSGKPIKFLDAASLAKAQSDITTWLLKAKPGPQHDEGVTIKTELDAEAERRLKAATDPAPEPPPTDLPFATSALPSREPGDDQPAPEDEPF